MLQAQSAALHDILFTVTLPSPHTPSKAQPKTTKVWQLCMENKNERISKEYLHHQRATYLQKALQTANEGLHYHQNFLRCKVCFWLFCNQYVISCFNKCRWMRKATTVKFTYYKWLSCCMYSLWHHASFDMSLDTGMDDTSWVELTAHSCMHCSLPQNFCTEIHQTTGSWYVT